MTSVLFTGKERDAESGLDFFGARYYGSALGRFTAPDPEQAGSDPGDPQSWNGYAYVTNNPLTSIDPDGLAGEKPCNPPDCWSTTVSAVADTIAVNFSFLAIRSILPTVQTVNRGVDWAGQPRNSSCLAATTGAGSVVGSQVGALGLIGGPAVGITEPTGIALGGGGGWAVGMFTCMSSSGGTGSGGQSAGTDKTAKKWQITNPADKKVVGARTYLKDGKTGTWWSKDTAGHGGSVWKVYRETSPGKLDWVADADAQGNFISGKWKSPVGTSVTF